MATHERLNPPGLFDARALAYTQVMKSRGETIVHVAGQAALSPSLEVIGAGDFGEQTRACFENLGIALAAAGARPADVASLRLYVVGHRAEYVPILKDALLGFFGSDALPPGTLVGVASLAMPELLIEIEATAVL
ncbi:MAG TPA: RidA family protein [Steroidobacteraceae bacterium]|nr:RidA family protein [Steroidobacteraceae bacterium]